MKYQLIREEEARNLPRTIEFPNSPEISKILGPARGYPKAFIKITYDDGSEKVASFKLHQDYPQANAPGFPTTTWAID